MQPAPPKRPTSLPPPPPVRAKPPAPIATAAAPSPHTSVTPATLRAPRHEPPPPPKRSTRPAPSVPPPLPITAPLSTAPLSTAPVAVSKLPPPLPAVAFEAPHVPTEPSMRAAPAYVPPPEPIAEPVRTTLPMPGPEPVLATAPTEPMLAVEPPRTTLPMPVHEPYIAPPAPAIVAAPEPALVVAPEPVVAAPEPPAVATPEPEVAPEPLVAAAAVEPDPIPDTIAAPAPADPSVVQADEIASYPHAAAFTTHQPEPHIAPTEFSSPGSEAPVVLTTPIPHVPERAPSALWALKDEWLPRAKDWSREHIAKNPRALVIGAPLLAALGIWIAHSLTPHTPRPRVVARPSYALEPNFTPHPAAAPAFSAIFASVAPPTAPTAAALPAPASAEELAKAESQGLPALESLSRKYPSDPQVGITLAAQQAQAQRYDAAVDTIEDLTRLAPSVAQSGKVMGILWRAAQSSASEQAFVALRKLGGRGTDVTFDLATTAGVRDAVRERAKSELASYLAFDSSNDTRAATALLLAPDCATRKSLLERAEREGGKRTLVMLERIARGSACTTNGDGACNSCMMGGTTLSHAIGKLTPAVSK